MKTKGPMPGDREFQYKLAKTHANRVFNHWGDFFHANAWDEDDLAQHLAQHLIETESKWQPGRGTSYRTYAISTLIHETQNKIREFSRLKRHPGKGKNIVSLTPAVEAHITPRGEQNYFPVNLEESALLEAVKKLRLRTRADLKKYRSIFISLYGLEDGVPKSHHEVGEMHGMSHEGVIYVEKVMLDRLVRDPRVMKAAGFQEKDFPNFVDGAEEKLLKMLEGLQKPPSGLPESSWEKFKKAFVSFHGLEDSIPKTIHSVIGPMRMGPENFTKWSNLVWSELARRHGAETIAPLRRQIEDA